MFNSISEIKKELEEGKVVKFKIKALPNSKNDGIEFCPDFIKIKIKAKATDGKANKAIVEFLSKELKFPKSKINILNGHKSAIKTIELG